MLAVPATSVPSEKMFSSAGLIVTKLRNKLSSEVVDQIIFLNKNKIKVPRNEPHITESWLTGNVKPIYKNKGNHLDPNNFRPITILSCFGKLFTAVLLTRLNAFSEKISILNENRVVLGRVIRQLIIFLFYIPSLNC